MMSIDRTPKITPTTLSPIRQNAAKRAGKGATPQAARAGTRVSLSHQLQALQRDESQDLDYAQLDKIKSALASGELPIDTDKIAHSLVRDIFSL